MTSKWMRSAPACSTASTSSPRRAKSADRMEGAIQLVSIVLRILPASDAAAFAHQLPGLDDLLGPLLGMLDHRLRQAIGFELVGVMAAELAPIRQRELLLAVLRGAFQHFVRLRQSQLLVHGRAAATAAGVA